MIPISTKNGLAIGGYDPVDLVRTGRAAPGSASHTYDWSGATWRFASDANRQAFAADPDSFTPEFGGHCALAMSLGKAAPGDPEVWSIVDDRLYLNKNPVAKLLWKLIPGRIDAARKKWEVVREG